MKLAALLILAAAAIPMIGILGCRPVCDAAMPTVTKAETYDTNARAVLAQARVMAEVLPDPPKSEVVAGLDACDVALSAIEAGLIGFEEVCQSVDPVTTYAPLIAAWTAVEPKLHSGLNKKFGATVQGVPVPLIVLRARGL